MNLMLYEAIGTSLIEKKHTAIFKKRNNGFFMVALATNVFLTPSITCLVYKVLEQTKVSPRLQKCFTYPRGEEGHRRLSFTGDGSGFWNFTALFLFELISRSTFIMSRLRRNNVC